MSLQRISDAFGSPVEIILFIVICGGFLLAGWALNQETEFLLILTTAISVLAITKTQFQISVRQTF